MSPHIFHPQTERCIACQCDRLDAPKKCAGTIVYRQFLVLVAVAPVWLQVPVGMPFFWRTENAS